MINFPDIPDEAPDALVSFHFEDVQFELPDEQQLSDWLQDVVKNEGKAFIEVNYIFCSDEKLRDMNEEYLDHDYYTDVITFPYSDDAVHGDVFISYDRVADNARQLNVAFEQELCRVLVHGVLHLSGYLDKTDAEEKVMREKEDFYLKRMFG
ncbi:MAG: rRNA maturation RNase YbeY [Chitinophagales bacterium]|nr:rRNA maturation RNase YbeY [Saprospiraceae bacterium]MBN8678934.1 rRNA maturation RNase YbeY [Chitinophagales bacterium]